MYKYTNKDSLSHIQKVKISDTEAIKIINEAGGIAVLAHPIEIKEKIVETSWDMVKTILII